MSRRPNSRALAPSYAERIAALNALGIELHTIVAHAEVSDSTLRRVRGGQPVVRATARSIELSVDLLIGRHVSSASTVAVHSASDANVMIGCPGERPTSDAATG